MKYIKSFIIMAMCLMANSIFAAQTAKVYITITADGTTYSDVLKLWQDDAVDNEFSDLDNATKIMNTMTSNSINIWAENGNDKYGAVVINDLHDLVIKVKANGNHTNYTLSFSKLAGEALGADVKLMLGTTEVALDAPYSFTCAVNEEKTFVLKMHANVYTRTVSNVWGTICLPQSVDAANITNATIYSVASKTETNLYLEEVTTGMVAGTPYIFKADAAGDVKFAYNNDAVLAPVAATGLVGTFENTTIGAEGMYVISSNVVRLATSTSTVKANRAYINLNEVGPYAPAPGRKLVPVRIANATTDIENAAEAAEIEKQIVNGQLLIRKAGVLYNVQGQIVK